MPINSFQWGSHATQVAPKPTSITTNQDPPNTQEQVETPMEKILNKILQSNETNAAIVKQEMGGLSLRFNNTEKAITNDINSLKKTINANAAEFRKDIQRIDKRLEENDARTANLIEQALKKERENWANRMTQMEEKLTAIENRNIPIENIPIEEAEPRVAEEPGPSGVNDNRDQILSMTFNNTVRPRQQRQGNQIGEAKRSKHPEVLDEEH